MTAVPASRWIADHALVLFRRIREFNAAQVELHQRWMRRYGVQVGVASRR